MENKTLAYRIGKGIVDGSGKVGKAVRKTIEYVKDEPLCFTYPLLGNLSQEIQERIEGNSFPPKMYRGAIATPISAISNLALYPILVYHLSNGNSKYALGGLVYSMVEMAARTIFSEPYSESSKFTRPNASLPGKIISLPLEGILGAYDTIKEKKKEK
jgi:hypothetical protein